MHQGEKTPNKTKKNQKKNSCSARLLLHSWTLIKPDALCSFDDEVMSKHFTVSTAINKPADFL